MWFRNQSTSDLDKYASSIDDCSLHIFEAHNTAYINDRNANVHVTDLASALHQEHFLEPLINLLQGATQNGH